MIVYDEVDISNFSLLFFCRSWAESRRRNEDRIQDAASPVLESQGDLGHTESSLPSTLLLGGSRDPDHPSVARKVLPSRESRHARQNQEAEARFSRLTCGL